MRGWGIPPAGPPLNESAAEILKAIQASWAALEAEISGVQVDVSLVRQNLQNVVDRVSEAEGCISELEDTVTELCTTVQQLTSPTKTLEARTEDAQYHARQNNFRFVGFPEGSEGRASKHSWKNGSSAGCYVRNLLPAL